jgi:hypothetical protein
MERAWRVHQISKSPLSTPFTHLKHPPQKFLSKNAIENQCFAKALSKILPHFFG